LTINIPCIPYDSCDMPGGATVHCAILHMSSLFLISNSAISYIASLLKKHIYQ